jgi:iron complex outermembrane receptor protein
MQVYIDGRSVNGDFLNLTFWHELPISLNEIDRIEIVRSPASALFSAVAFSGVIHIITKAPEDLKGTHIYQTAGNAGSYITNLIHAGVADKFGYKLSYEYDRANQFPNRPLGRSSDDKGREDFRGNILAEYKFTEASKAALSAGIDGFDRDIVPGLGDNLARFSASGGIGFVKFNYSLGDFRFQTYWDRLDMDLRSTKLPTKVSVLSDSWKSEAQYSARLGKQNLLTGGVGYRFSVFDAPLLTGPKRKQHFFDAFLQHEYSPMDNLKLTLGGRVDTHPEAGVHFSPRGSIVYSPWKDHTFRASISRGFRNPTVIENFVNLGILSPFGPVTVLGDKDLDSEEILSYELGYQTLLLNRLKARIDLFYNKLDKLLLGPRSLPSNPLVLQLFTAGGGSIYGGEIAVEVLFTDWLKGFTNYSFQQRNVDWDLLGIGSRHKGNVGLSFTLPKDFEVDLYLNWAGKGSGFPGGVDPYSMVNLRLGYRFELLGTKGSVFFGASNLFNDRHREVPGGDIIERRIAGGLQFKF